MSRQAKKSQALVYGCPCPKEVSKREMAAIAKSGSAAADAAHAYVAMLMQNCATSCAHGAEFIREAIKCGSLDDIQALQMDYARRLTLDYFNEATAFCDVLFDACSHTLKPVEECVNLAIKQAGKAIAA